MSGTALVSAIIEILVAGITGVATGIGQGMSTLVNNIFFVTVEGTTSLSTLGICICAFAGISLALSLAYLMFNWLGSFGKNR